MWSANASLAAYLEWELHHRIRAEFQRFKWWFTEATVLKKIKVQLAGCGLILFPCCIYICFVCVIQLELYKVNDEVVRLPIATLVQNFLKNCYRRAISPSIRTNSLQLWFPNIWGVTTYSPSLVTCGSEVAMSLELAAGFVLLSLNIALNKLITATPSPHECSKLTAASPSDVISNETLLSNHLNWNKKCICLT